MRVHSPAVQHPDSCSRLEGNVLAKGLPHQRQRWCQCHLQQVPSFPQWKPRKWAGQNTRPLPAQRPCSPSPALPASNQLSSEQLAKGLNLLLGLWQL